MQRLTTFILVSVFAGLVSGAALAQSQWQVGEHYDEITVPVNVGSSDRVVVTEFFWYGCGHCYAFEPMLSAWEKQLPEGAVLEPSPAIWNPAMTVHARAFYTAKALGVLETMHPAIFDAMHKGRQRLATESALRELFVANGVDEVAFERAFNSFGVNSQVQQAEARARAARISGTPSMMVAGKFLIETRKSGSQANMLSIVDALVAEELAAQTAQ